ncbi:MAG TPA: hypothetical protein VJA18_03645 [Candidatus Nanoarchaeia archaeon]|nr:hypothetical protein [Candidatus Nanoarchaeia archaeon]
MADGSETVIEESAPPLEHSLAPAQIRYLYLWVHPQWSSPWSHDGIDIEIEEYKKFIHALKTAPRTGMVQIANEPRQEYMQNEVYARFIEELKRFDEYAMGLLGDRYLVWNKTRFIDARNPEQVRKLVDKFNLLETGQDNFVLERERWQAKDPKYLAKISVFGKERDTCPLGQATLFGLNNLASIVRYHSQEIPCGIIPPSPTNQFPGDGNAVYIFEK